VLERAVASAREPVLEVDKALLDEGLPLGRSRGLGAAPGVPLARRGARGRAAAPRHQAAQPLPVPARGGSRRGQGARLRPREVGRRGRRPPDRGRRPDRDPRLHAPRARDGRPRRRDVRPLLSRLRGVLDAHRQARVLGGPDGHARPPRPHPPPRAPRTRSGHRSPRPSSASPSTASPRSPRDGRPRRSSSTGGSPRSSVRSRGRRTRPSGGGASTCCSSRPPLRAAIGATTCCPCRASTEPAALRLRLPLLPEHRGRPRDVSRRDGHAIRSVIGSPGRTRMRWARPGGFRQFLMQPRSFPCGHELPGFFELLLIRSSETALAEFDDDLL